MTYSIIGAGNCFRLWNDALRETGNRFGSVCDTNQQRHSQLHCPTYTELDDFLENDKSDYIILATPVSTHYPLAKKIINAGRNIIIEKPISYDYLHVEELCSLADNKGVRLECSYHSAYAIDVDYFLDHRVLLEKEMGQMIGFECDFCDPYVKGGKIVTSAQSLYGSYLDSAINALSVIGRLIGLEDMISLTDTMPFISEENTQSRTLYKKGNIQGVIRTDWKRGINFKATTLIYTNGIIYMNHSMQRIARRKAESTTEIDCNPLGKERLINQYVSTIRAIEKAGSEISRHKMIHRLLLTK